MKRMVTVDMADGAAATGEERGVTIGNILVDTHYTVIEDENGYQTEGYVVRQGEPGRRDDRRGRYAPLREHARHRKP